MGRQNIDTGMMAADFPCMERADVHNVQSTCTDCNTELWNTDGN
jgi:hypothetical protein